MKCKGCGKEIYEVYGKGSGEWSHVDFDFIKFKPHKPEPQEKKERKK